LLDKEKSKIKADARYQKWSRDYKNLSYSFKAIPRDNPRFEEGSDSPGVGKYSPNYNVCTL